jgi:hypothetical protein
MLERVVYKSVFVSDHDMAGVHHRDGDCRKAFEALKSRGVKFETGVLEWGCSRILTATGCSCGIAGGR